MKIQVGLFSLALIATLRLAAQDQVKEWNALTGTYRMELDTTQLFTVKKENDKLVLAVEQGQTLLMPLGGNRFKPEHVYPATEMEFLKDSLGRVQGFNWHQDRTTELIRVSGNGDTNPYTGRYQLKGNPYIVIQVQAVNGGIAIQEGKGMAIKAHFLSGDQFIFEKGGLKLLYTFSRHARGVVEGMKITRTGPQVFVRLHDAGAKIKPYTGQVFTDNHPWNRADSLRGMLTPVRTCYDVLFYALDIRVMPETKSIAGNTTIRFRAMQPFDRMQVDLFANMHIEKILFHGRPLPYTREYNAVLIRLPETLQKGTEDSISIYYNGAPRQPDMSSLQGGFFWLWDKNGNPWIESVCQGIGASLWWPCKDHLSDKPDSMRIAITVPDTLMNISNGVLQQVTTLPDHLKRFNWYVHYPINTYNVVVNIGKYAHHSEQYIRGKDTMPLHYYYMPYHAALGKHIFSTVKPMLTLFEKAFGPYPFKKDGFTIMESPYPMEHQGAISTGAFNNPFNSGQYDTAEVRRVAWHESAHEWWGNSITCKDMADLWIHEAFATYAEILCYEAFDGQAAALKYVREQVSGNKDPIIGTFNVNDFHLGDMYPKGGRMLYTLQHIIDNDSLWFNMLRGMQQHFKYESIATEDVVAFINRSTGHDFTGFFDQYLRHTAIPELLLTCRKKEDTLEVQYKWKADVAGFHMPVKVTTSKNRFTFIYPTTTQWKMLRLPNMQPEDLKADTDHFFITIKKQ
jgi:hypothetical protein